MHDINEEELSSAPIPQMLTSQKLTDFEIICYNLLKANKSAVWEFHHLSLTKQFYYDQEKVRKRPKFNQIFIDKFFKIRSEILRKCPIRYPSRKSGFQSLYGDHGTKGT